MIPLPPHRVELLRNYSPVLPTQPDGYVCPAGLGASCIPTKGCLPCRTGACPKMTCVSRPHESVTVVRPQIGAGKVVSSYLKGRRGRGGGRGYETRGGVGVPPSKLSLQSGPTAPAPAPAASAAPAPSPVEAPSPAHSTSPGPVNTPSLKVSTQPSLVPAPQEPNEPMTQSHTARS